MQATLWFIIAGLLLVLMAVSGSTVKRLPLTTALLYLVAGVALGPRGLDLLRLDPRSDAAMLERLTEIAVLISLFTAGLKLRNPWNDRRWRLPLLLATTSMVLTIGLVSVAGVTLLALPLGAAVLLGAILAPTDPVLASDVQVENAGDRDRLRFALTGEAGLNDGTAFPFVMLGLGLLGVHEIGEAGVRWVAIDLGWAVIAGVGVGWLIGTLVVRLVLYLRRTHREAVGLYDLLALGLIALAYGAALAVGGYGFLAVFTAGLAVRRIERRETSRGAGGEAPVDVRAVAAGAVVSAPGGDRGTAAGREQLATSASTAPAYMAEAALGFSEQLERIAELAVVLMLGSMLGPRTLAWEGVLIAALLFVVIRPVAVLIGAPMRGAPRGQRWLASWFGIRGIGSLYYLLFAIGHAVPPALGERLTAIVITVVVTSIVVHGISVTPLMSRYQRRSLAAAGSPGDAGRATA
jgi:NhaP-type Na+/H+ or K+/H+ antiporter